MVKIRKFLYFFINLIVLGTGAGLIALTHPEVAANILSVKIDYSYNGLTPCIDLSRSELMIIGGFFVLIELVYFLSMALSRKQEATIWYENPEGRVEITVKAVEDFVRKIASEIEDVKEIEPTIRESKGGIRVVAKVALWTGSDLPTLTQKIQHSIKDKIQNVIGIADVSSVEVSIARIQAREVRTPTPVKTETEPQAPTMVPNQ